VSPARARTSNDDIVAAGRELLEAGGLDAVTMLAVAQRVGVRAPSLYKRFADRGALIGAIGSAALRDLAEELQPSAADPDPASGLIRIASAFRAFAKRNPHAYELLFMNLPQGSRPPPEQNAHAVAPLLQVTERLVGEDRALEAARLVTAFAHGFVSMEITGAFRLGGDVDEAYRYGVGVLVDGLVDRAGGPINDGSGQPTAPV
jgi:AcrR family transcriptional regulator